MSEYFITYDLGPNCECYDDVIVKFKEKKAEYVASTAFVIKIKASYKINDVEKWFKGVISGLRCKLKRCFIVDITDCERRIYPEIKSK